MKKKNHYLCTNTLIKLVAGPCNQIVYSIRYPFQECAKYDVKKMYTEYIIFTDLENENRFQNIDIGSVSLEFAVLTFSHSTNQIKGIAVVIMVGELNESYSIYKNMMRISFSLLVETLVKKMVCFDFLKKMVRILEEWVIRFLSRIIQERMPIWYILLILLFRR